MNPVLLGIGLVAGLLIFLVGVILVLVKKNALAGIFLALAGVAVIGGVIMFAMKPKADAKNNNQGTLIIESPGTETVYNTEEQPTETPAETEGNTPYVEETDRPTPTPTEGPTPTPTVEPGKYTEVHYNASTIVKPSNFNNSIIYLTFDDGPSVVTGEILDVLKKYNIKATFFLVGSEIRSETAQYVRRAIDEGHSVGIHAYTHDPSVIYVSADAYLHDFYKVDQVLKEQFNYRALIFRFPGGASNESSKQYCVGIMTDLTKRMPELGYSYFDWNVSPEDAMAIVDPSVISGKVLDALRSNRPQNVILMHDFDKMGSTAKALSTIIETALEQGYAFDRLTPETTPMRHKVFN